MMTTTAVCVCGHPQQQHEHYRPGEDCVVCGCMTYRTPHTVSVTVAVGWILILAFLIVFWGAVIWGLLHMAGEL